MGSKATGSLLKYLPHFTEGYILSNKTYFDVLQSQFAEEIKNIRLSCPVAKIDYSSENGEVSVELENGTIFQADFVVCTVPITQLRKNKIQFTPELSPQRQAEIAKLDLDCMGQYFLKFSERFWPKDLFWLTTIDAGISWVSSQSRSDQDSTITFHTIGERARLMSSPEGLEQEKLNILNSLSSIFQVDAHQLFLDAYYMDWTVEPYIEGGYSYPVLNENDARQIAFSNVQNKIFFAGECCSLFNYATIHGAVETGIDKAQEIISITGLKPSQAYEKYVSFLNSY